MSLFIVLCCLLTFLCVYVSISLECTIDLIPGARSSNKDVSEPVEQKIYFSDAVVFGKAEDNVTGLYFELEQYPGMYTVRFEVLCVYKGDNISSTIYIAGMGNTYDMVPECPRVSVSFDRSVYQIMYLRRTHLSNVYEVEFKADEGDIETIKFMLKDLVASCGIHLKTYKRIDFCQQVQPTEDCNQYIPPVYPGIYGHIVHSKQTTPTRYPSTRRMQKPVTLTRTLLDTLRPGLQTTSHKQNKRTKTVMASATVTPSTTDSRSKTGRHRTDISKTKTIITSTTEKPSSSGTWLQTNKQKTEMTTGKDKVSVYEPKAQTSREIETSTSGHSDVHAFTEKAVMKNEQQSTVKNKTDPISKTEEITVSTDLPIKILTDKNVKSTSSFIERTSLQNVSEPYFIHGLSPSFTQNVSEPFSTVLDNVTDQVSNIYPDTATTSETETTAKTTQSIVKSTLKQQGTNHGSADITNDGWQESKMTTTSMDFKNIYEAPVSTVRQKEYIHLMSTSDPEITSTKDDTFSLRNSKHILPTQETLEQTSLKKLIDVDTTQSTKKISKSTPYTKANISVTDATIERAFQSTSLSKENASSYARQETPPSSSELQNITSHVLYSTSAQTTLPVSIPETTYRATERPEQTKLTIVSKKGKTQTTLKMVSETTSPKEALKIVDMHSDSIILSTSNGIILEQEQGVSPDIESPITRVTSSVTLKRLEQSTFVPRSTQQNLTSSNKKQKTTYIPTDTLLKDVEKEDLQTTKQPLLTISHQTTKPSLSKEKTTTKSKINIHLYTLMDSTRRLAEESKPEHSNDMVDHDVIRFKTHSTPLHALHTVSRSLERASAKSVFNTMTKTQQQLSGESTTQTTRIPSKNNRVNSKYKENSNSIPNSSRNGNVPKQNEMMSSSPTTTTLHNTEVSQTNSEFVKTSHYQLNIVSPPAKTTVVNTVYKTRQQPTKQFSKYTTLPSTGTRTKTSTGGDDMDFSELDHIEEEPDIETSRGKNRSSNTVGLNAFLCLIWTFFIVLCVKQ